MLLVLLSAHPVHWLMHRLGILPKVNIKGRSCVLSKVGKCGLKRRVPWHPHVAIAISACIWGRKQLLVLCGIICHRLLLLMIWRFLQIVIVEHSSVWVHSLGVLMIYGLLPDLRDLDRGWLIHGPTVFTHHFSAEGGNTITRAHSIIALFDLFLQRLPPVSSI